MKCKAKGDWAHTRFSCTFVIFVVNSAAHSGFRNHLPSAGVTLRFTPACGLSLLRSFGYSLPSAQGLRYVSPLPVVLPLLRSLGYSLPSQQGLRFAHPSLWSASPSGLLFSAERPIKSTILRAPQIDPEQTARAPSLALMIRSNFGLSLV